MLPFIAVRKQISLQGKIVINRDCFSLSSQALLKIWYLNLESSKCGKGPKIHHEEYYSL